MSGMCRVLIFGYTWISAVVQKLGRPELCTKVTFQIVWPRPGTVNSRRPTISEVARGPGPASQSQIFHNRPSSPEHVDFQFHPRVPINGDPHLENFCLVCFFWPRVIFALYSGSVPKIFGWIPSSRKRLESIKSKTK